MLARRVVVPAAAAAAAQVATSPLPYGFLSGIAHRMCYGGLLGCDSVQSSSNISKKSSASSAWRQIGSSKVSNLPDTKRHQRFGIIFVVAPCILWFI